MSKLEWDKTGERFYETGVRKVVLYPKAAGTYPKGVAWNGVTSIEESPSGAEASPLYANDTKYLNLMSTEEYGASITAYTYPDEFAACDGSASLATGVSIGQQKRTEFGLCYRTAIGNDEDGTEHGYKLHLVYGCLASPSSKSHTSINNDPEATEMSWELTTTPVEVTGHRPTATVEIDSTKVDADALALLEAMLYGSESEEARLPLPDEIAELFAEGE